MKESNVMQTQVGKGEQTYAEAKGLLDSWKHLELEWSTCAIPGIQDGTVQTKVSHFAHTQQLPLHGLHSVSPACSSHMQGLLDDTGFALSPLPCGYMCMQEGTEAVLSTSAPGIV